MLFLVTSCLLLGFIDFLNVAAHDPFFRKDYTFNADTQSFYKLHTIRRSWMDARRRCLMEGSQLFFPESSEEAVIEDNIITEKLSNFNLVWIGVSDLIAEGDFETVDGRPLEEVYSDWQNGEPNDSSNNEDCVVMIKQSKKMNDGNCADKFPFMCKKTRATIEWNAICEVPDSHYLYNNDLGKCYKFHSRPLNWADAHSVCVAEQSYLAVINSQAEADHFVRMIAAAPKDYKGLHLRGVIHLGFHNKYGEGYSTVYGSPLEDSGYVKWGAGQPDNREVELCGSMFYNGGLNDLQCNAVSYFICEHDLGSLGSSLDDRVGSSVRR